MSQAQLVIAGGASLLDHDAYHRRFEAVLQDRHLGDAVVLTGPLPDADLPALLRRADALLIVASERVWAKFGFACSRALDQLAEIEATAARFTTAPDAQVEVLAFHE